MAPQTMLQWTVEGKDGFDSLKLNESAPVPKIGDRDVLVKSNYPEFEQVNRDVNSHQFTRLR